MRLRSVAFLALAALLTSSFAQGKYSYGTIYDSGDRSGLAVATAHVETYRPFEFELDELLIGGTNLGKTGATTIGAGLAHSFSLSKALGVSFGFVWRTQAGERNHGALYVNLFRK